MRRMEKKNKKFALFIGMNKGNHIKNISISILLSLLAVYLLSLKGWTNSHLLIFFIVSFVFLFRMGEYLISKKFIYYFIGGAIAEGRRAFIDLVVYLVLYLLLFITLFLK